MCSPQAGGRGRGIPPGALADPKRGHGPEDAKQRQEARATDEARLEPPPPRSPPSPSTLHALRASRDPAGAPGAARKDPGSFPGSRAPRRGAGTAGPGLMPRVGGEGTGAGRGGGTGHPAEAFPERGGVGFESPARLSPPGTYGAEGKEGRVGGGGIGEEFTKRSLCSGVRFIPSPAEQAAGVVGESVGSLVIGRSDDSRSMRWGKRGRR